MAVGTGKLVTIFHTFDLSGAAANAGDILSIANPEGASVVIIRAVLHIETASNGAATVDVGVAANGTTLSDNLIDGANINATGAYDNIVDKGTNGKEKQLWTSTQYVTVSKATGAANAEVSAAGYLMIEYIRKTTASSSRGAATL